MTKVLLFTQETCGACATQRENNDGIEDAYPDVEFREVDSQSSIETVEAYGVRKTPTTLVYANDGQTAEFIGIVDATSSSQPSRARPSSRPGSPTASSTPWADNRSERFNT